MSMRFLFVATLIILSSAPIAFAAPGLQSTGNTIQTQSTGNTTDTKLINPLKSGDSLEQFLLNILDFVIRIGAIAVVLMTVFVGYKFVAARGEPSAITEARTMLLWTVVGALILLGSQAIATAIKDTVKALGG